MNKEDQQKKQIEFQILNQQFESLKQQLAKLQQQSVNLDELFESLEALEKTKENTDLFTPISSGVFVKSSLKDNSEVIMSVGASTAVKKTMPQAKDLISNQKKEITTVIAQLEKDLHQYVNTLNSLHQELN